MRKFNIPRWQQAVETIHDLSVKKNYVVIIRLQYYLILRGNSSFIPSIRKFFLDQLAFLNIIKNVIKYQFFIKKENFIFYDEFKFVVFLSDQVSYLKTILPIIHILIKKNENLLIFCPANHYKRLEKQLEPEIYNKLIIIETLPIRNKYLIIIKSLFLAIKDFIWLIFTNIEKSFITASLFTRFSFIYHLYYLSFHSLFNKGKKVFITTNDTWLWESVLAYSTLNSNSVSIMLQHGKLSDIYYPFISHKFYAWSIADFHEMTKIFFAIPNEIKVTGSPYYDNLYSKLKMNTENEAGADKQYITFLTQPYLRERVDSPELYKEIIDWIGAIDYKKYNKKIVFQKHPFDLENLYENLPDHIGFSSIKLIDILKKTIITVIVDSTAVLESTLIQVPVIQCIPKGGENLFSDMSDTGISLRAQDKAEFLYLVDKLLTNQEFYQQQLGNSTSALNYYFKNFGSSTETIYKELKNEII